jgi:hypothetical protein
MGQTGIEGYITYRHLVSGWGDRFLEQGEDPFFTIIVNLQPICDGLRG